MLGHDGLKKKVGITTSGMDKSARKHNHTILESAWTRSARLDRSTALAVSPSFPSQYNFTDLFPNVAVTRNDTVMRAQKRSVPITCAFVQLEPGLVVNSSRQMQNVTYT